MPPLVFDPFPLWERIRVLSYPCQPFIHSNVPTQMGHFDGSILPQKLVGTYNMWNWTSLGSFNWAKIAEISWKYWKNASAGDWVGRNLFLRVVSQKQLFGAHLFHFDARSCFWPVLPAQGGSTCGLPLSAFIHSNVPSLLGHFGGVISSPKAWTTYHRSN